MHDITTPRPPPGALRFAAAGVALAAALACGGAVAQAAAPGAEAAYAPGRILLKGRAGLPDAALARILTENGGGKARRIGKSDLRIVDLPPGMEARMVERLSRHPHIEFVELDRVFPAALTPNDPYFGSQWHQNKIRTPSAWDLTSGAGVTVAILDTGVDATHPELSASIVPGWNFYANSADTTDSLGHGTAVAGTVAAATNNGVGVASIAGGAKIMPIRISDNNGFATASTIAQAITYAADRGARVVNVSFENLPGSTAVQSAAQYMKDNNGLVVVAAGNTGTSVSWSSTTTMIPVSATGSTDQLASFTSWGPYVAMSAPGIDIWTTRAGGTYWYCWGTSFAAPVTAGVVALMMAANPELGSRDIERLLYASAVDLGAAGRDPQFGYGRVDAAAAVQAALSAVSTVDTTAPSVAIAAPLGSSTVSGLVPVNITASDDVGVARVELRVNGGTVAADTSAPFAFSWDSAHVADGMVNLTAVAVDAAGNARTSAAVSVNVANATAPVVADTSAPSVAIQNPGNGSRVSGSVSISVSASDNSGSAGITNSLFINNIRVAAASGGSLSYKWNTRKVATGTYTIRAEARDAAGNLASTSVQVTR